jgi:hypothetical protein
VQKEKEVQKCKKKGAMPVFGVFVVCHLGLLVLSFGLGPVIAQPGVCKPVEPSSPVDKGQQGLMSHGTDMRSITNPER